MRNWKIVAGAVTALLVGIVLATQADAGWFRRHGQGSHEPAARAEHAQRAVEYFLSNVDATDEQYEAARGIVDETLAALGEVQFDRRAIRGRVLELLSAESVDRDAIEALRTEGISAADRASSALTQGVVELAEMLTPEQRAQLEDLAGRHRGRHHGWH